MPKIPSADSPAFALGEKILDLLQDETPEVTADALGYAIRHHAIAAEMDGGDDCCLGWLAQLRMTVDAAESKLGDYIERDADRAAEPALEPAAAPERRAA